MDGVDGLDVGGLATANPVWVGSSELTMTDPAIVRIPAGEAVDGRRLLAQSVAFGRALRNDSV